MVVKKKASDAVVRKARVSKADPNETKADKFRRLASDRLGKAVTRIQQIGNLSGPGYEYTEEQRNKIVTILADAVQACAARFAPRTKEGKKEKPTFDL
jgi:hypothetical protein